MNLVEQAIQLRKELEAMKVVARKYVTVAELTPEELTELINLYDIWEAGKPVSVKDIMRRDGKLYEAIQAHTTQADWEPKNTPALWKEITPSETGGGEEIVPDYVKPTGGHDAHSKGYKARFLEKDGYDGKVRESLIYNNVWDYKEYPQGWKLVE